MMDSEKLIGDNQERSSSGNESVEASRPQIKVRQDWYQTDAIVVVSLLAKNLRAEDAVDIRITENSVDFTAKLADDVDADCSVHLDLYAAVAPARSSWKRFPSKVEIKLVKEEANVWRQLEKLNQSPVEVCSTKTHVPSYPSGNVLYRDWDKIAADFGRLEADEQVEGEAGVNKLFQDLYEGGSDEVRRAMNKSFMESGGTVLSTNWNEVGKEEVKMKPPDGVEFKKWDE